MPAQKKPADRRQRTNAPKEMDASIVALNTARKAPAVPTELGEELAEEWQELWSSELGAHFVKSDVPALRRLFRLRQRVDDWEAEVFGGADVAYDEDGVPISMGPLSKGSTGQLAVHPLIKEADVWRGQILALEDRFGLNPQARLKLGIALGQAQQSLDDMNRRLMQKSGGGAASERPDPRLGVIDTTAT